MTSVPAAARSVLVLDGLSIDPGERRVVVRGEEVALTLREFDLLAFLARQPPTRRCPWPARRCTTSSACATPCAPWARAGAGCGCRRAPTTRSPSWRRRATRWSSSSRPASDSADGADGARRSLTAAVSHDVRTPLASLRVLAEAIAALGALVDDLFELSRLEAGDVQWSMQRVRLDELVEETLEAMRPQAATRGIATEARMAPDPPTRADPERLRACSST